MTRTRSLVPIGTLGIALLLVACSTSGSPAATGAGNGRSISSIDPCSLLTPAEIKTALGFDVKAGVAQSTDTQVDCEWESQDGGSSVGVTVAMYDDAVWQALSKTSNAKPISGFGDAAYTGVPHAGDIAIKKGSLEIDLGIVNFTIDEGKIDAADQSLATLVLSRV
jgi:hypothetical protein